MKSTVCFGMSALALAMILLAVDRLAASRSDVSSLDSLQSAPPKSGVEIVNAAGKARHIDEKMLKELPRHKITISDASGKPSIYDGVILMKLLECGGIKIESELRGARLTNYLLVEAKDGYRVLFSLPEIDPAMTDNVVLFADTKDGKALDDKEGPYRILVPNEKQHPRWIRQVVRMSEHAATGSAK